MILIFVRVFDVESAVIIAFLVLPQDRISGNLQLLKVDPLFEF